MAPKVGRRVTEHEREAVRKSFSKLTRVITLLAIEKLRETFEALSRTKISRV